MVSMVLIGYNKHEPDMLRCFWYLYFAGTIKPPANTKTCSGVFVLWGTLYIWGNDYLLWAIMGYLDP